MLCVQLSAGIMLEAIFQAVSRRIRLLHAYWCCCSSIEDAQVSEQATAQRHVPWSYHICRLRNPTAFHLRCIP